MFLNVTIKEVTSKEIILYGNANLIRWYRTETGIKTPFFSFSSCVWRYLEHRANHCLALSRSGVFDSVRITSRRIVGLPLTCTTSALGRTKYFRYTGSDVPVKFLILWFKFTWMIKSWTLPLKCNCKIQRAMKEGLITPKNHGVTFHWVACEYLRIKPPTTD